MLIDVATDRELTRVPHEADFNALRRRLSSAEFNAAVDHINQLIDDAGADIATAGWLPGADWTDTPLEPIYATAARGDQNRAAMFFGQLVWFVVMGRPERWGFGR